MTEVTILGMITMMNFCFDVMMMMIRMMYAIGDEMMSKLFTCFILWSYQERRGSFSPPPPLVCVRLTFPIHILPFHWLITITTFGRSSRPFVSNQMILLAIVREIYLGVDSVCVIHTFV
jgi:hypothetical protein